MDGCAAVAAYLSPEKARTAALGQRGSGGYDKMINDGRTAFLCVDVLKGTPIQPAVACVNGLLWVIWICGR